MFSLTDNFSFWWDAHDTSRLHSAQYTLQVRLLNEWKMLSLSSRVVSSPLLHSLIFFGCCVVFSRVPSGELWAAAKKNKQTRGGGGGEKWMNNFLLFSLIVCCWILRVAEALQVTSSCTTTEITTRRVKRQSEQWQKKWWRKRALFHFSHRLWFLRITFYIARAIYVYTLYLLNLKQNEPWKLLHCVSLSLLPPTEDWPTHPSLDAEEGEFHRRCKKNVFAVSSSM